jgi:ribosomal protein S6--L-glutamate ligase
MKIAILTYAPRAKSTKSIIAAARSRGHSVITLNPEELAMYISDNPSGHDKLYRKIKGELKRVFANSIDAVIPRIGTNISYTTTIVDHLNRNLGVFSTQSGEGLRIASNKLLTLQKCSEQNLPTPRTVYAKDPSMIDEYLNMVGGAPVIVKTTSGSLGEGVLLLDSYMSAKSTIQALFKQKTNILIQEFIPSNGVDYRGIVIGNEVVAAYRRHAKKNDFRANIHKGATAVPIELSQDDKDFCVKCARVLGLKTAGIDFMKDSSRQTRLIEVNGNYGFHIQEVTGIDLGDKLIRFIEEEYERFKPENLNFPTKEEVIIRRQKAEIDKLQRSNEYCKKELHYFLKNPKVASLYRKYQGKTLNYTNSDQIQSERKIVDVRDLYEIMVDILKIKK